MVPEVPEEPEDPRRRVCGTREDVEIRSPARVHIGFMENYCSAWEINLGNGLTYIVGHMYELVFGSG